MCLAQSHSENSAPKNLQARLKRCPTGIGACLKAFRPLIQVLIKKNRVNRLCGLSKFFSAGQLDEPGPLDLLLPDQRLLPPPSRCHRWRLPWDSHGNVHTVKTKTLFTTNLEAFVTMSFSRLRKEDLAFGRFYPEEIRLFYDHLALYHKNFQRSRYQNETRKKSKYFHKVLINKFWKKHIFSNK